MTITIELTDRAASNLLADAQLQRRPTTILIAEAVEARYGGAHGETPGVLTIEDDPYSAAMRYGLTDTNLPGRTYELDETDVPAPGKGFAVE